MSRNSQCNLCSLSDSSSTVCLWGSGSGDVMIIGDAPSASNIHQGEYLSGGPGKVLKAELEKVGDGKWNQLSAKLALDIFGMRSKSRNPSMY